MGPRGVAYVRTVMTASGAPAVQIVLGSWRGGGRGGEVHYGGDGSIVLVAEGGDGTAGACCRPKIGPGLLASNLVLQP